MPSTPLPRRTAADAIRRAQLHDSEQSSKYGEFEGLLNDWLYVGENDCAEAS
jgi:hypothetical protein